MGGRAASAKRRYKKSGFDKESLEKHYARHVIGRKDTIAKSPREYEKMAIAFRDKKIKKSSPIEEFVSHTGLRFRYDKKTNEFIIVKNSGEIVTYYYPTDKLKYWETQIKLHKFEGEK